MNPAAWSPWLSNLDAAAYLIVAALVIWLAFFGDRSKGRKRCPKCWYDMAAAPPPGLTCPECGHQCKTASQLHKSRWRWRPVVWGALACLLTFTVSNWANLRAGAWLNLIPATVLFVVVEPDYTSPAPRILLPQFARPAAAPFGASLEGAKQLLARELARRHKAGELPEWMWRRLSLRECVIPIESDRTLYTRPMWLKGQNLILGSDALPALINAPNVASIRRSTRVEITAAARAMGIGAWASMIDYTSLPSRPVSEARIHIDTSTLGLGKHRIPLALTCKEEVGSRSIVLWRADRVIDVEFVENFGEAIALVDDAASNDAVRRCARVVVSSSQGTSQGFSSTGARVTTTIIPASADLPLSCEGAPLLKNLGVAFGFVFLESGREVARCEDSLFPSLSGGLVFETAADKARLTNGLAWTETALRTLTVRVVGRPEAVLPQLGFRWAWSGSYESPLSDFVFRFSPQ